MLALTIIKNILSKLAPAPSLPFFPSKKKYHCLPCVQGKIYTVSLTHSSLSLIPKSSPLLANPCQLLPKHPESLHLHLPPSPTLNASTSFQVLIKSTLDPVPLNQTPCFHSGPTVVNSPGSGHSDLLKMQVDHVTLLLQTFQ